MFVMELWLKLMGMNGHEFTDKNVEMWIACKVILSKEFTKPLLTWYHHYYNYWGFLFVLMKLFQIC